MRIALPAACGLVLWCAPMPAHAAELKAAGATFPYPIYAKWFEAFSVRHAEVKIQYQALGSEAGIRMLREGAVDFAASDMALSDRQLAEFNGAVRHFPSVLGAVVPIYNLPSIARDLQFTPEALAQIFLGRIRKWNDPALRAANRGLQMPDREIAVVHRGDGSGTTYVWTDYLAKVSPEWRASAGSGTRVAWPAGASAEGNEGVVKKVAETPGSIGYVEYIYAVENRLAYGAVRNQAGRYVQANLESIAKAVPADLPADLRVSITNAPDAGAYPIAAFTYLLVPARIEDPAKRQAVRDFLEWMLMSGQRQAAALGYVALPKSVVSKERRVLEDIR